MKAFWQTLKGRRRQLAVMSVMALGLSVVLLRYQHEFEHEEEYGDNRWPAYTLLQVFELKLFDERMRRRGRLPTGDEIVILAIDHESMQNIGDWPFPRQCHARIVDRLREAGAKIIAFDVDFSSSMARGAKDDAAFAKACARARNVILAANLEEGSKETVERQGGDFEATDVSREIYPIPELEDACLGTGFITVREDIDAFVRTIDAAWYNDAFEETLPFFGPMVAGTYEGLTPEQITDWTRNRLKGKKRVPYVHGFQMLINYAGPVRSFLTHSYYYLGMEQIPQNNDLVNTLEARRKLFKDKLVLIGGTADELRDNRPSPYFRQGNTPGVEIHANAVRMFLDQHYLGRASSKVTGPILLLVALITGFITVLVGKPVSVIATQIDTRLSFSVRGTRFGFYGLTWFVLYLLGAMVPPIVVFTAVNQWLFAKHDLVFPLGYPLVGIAATYFLGIFYMFLTEEQERKKMHGRFQRY